MKWVQALLLLQLLLLLSVQPAFQQPLLNSDSDEQLQTFLKTEEDIRLIYPYAPAEPPSDTYRDGGFQFQNTIQLQQITELQIAKGTSFNSHVLFVDTKAKIVEHEIDPSTQQKTHYLPWMPNHATFMQLNHLQFGDWFFTAELSGCEVWIAHDRKGKQPFIIHLNLFNCENKPEDMVKLGDEAVQRIMELYPGYNLLIKRIVRKKQSESMYPSGTAFYKEDVDALFYGRYTQSNKCEDKSIYSGGWSFYLRDRSTKEYLDLSVGTTKQARFQQLFSPAGTLCRSLGKWNQKSPDQSQHMAIQAEGDPFCLYIKSKLSAFSDEGRMTLSGPSIKFAFFQGFSEIIAGTANHNSTINFLELFPTSITNGIGYPFNSIQLKSVSYNCNSTKLKIVTRTSTSLNIIPGILKLYNATISFESTLSPVHVIAFIIRADWALGGISGHFTIEDNIETGQLYIEGGPHGEVTLNFEDIIGKLAREDLSLPIGSLTFRDVLIHGAIDTISGGTATFSIRGKYGQNNLIYIALQKQVSSSSKYAAAFASEFSSFKFAELMDDLTGVDISDIPLFGSLVVPHMAVTIATDDIQLIEQFDTQLLSLTGYHVGKGFTAFFMFTNEPVSMSYSNYQFSFKVLNGKSVRVKSLLSQIPGLNLDSLDLPPGVSNLLDLAIRSFALNTTSKELTFSAILPDSLKFFDDQLTIQNPAVVMHAVLKSPRKIYVDVSGKIEIGGKGYSIVIVRDETSDRYVLKVDIGRIDIANIIKEFGAAVVPDELSSIVRSAGFIQFAINDVHITYPFGGKPKQIQIAGEPQISGFNVPLMSAIIIKQAGKSQLIQGFQLGRVKISDLIRSISGHSVSSIAILNQELEAAILISPVTLPGVNLVGSKLSGFSINKGVSFQAVMQWPPGCSSDAFCAVAQSALGADAKFSLQGTIANARSFILTAAVTNVRLGSVVLANAGLKVTVGNQAEVGIFGSVKLTNPAIILTGAIRVGTRGVVLEMMMSGCWEQAFGADWLTVCNLQISVSLKPGVPLAGFAFGGEIKLGNPSCGNQIQASGFIGIDPLSPQENYYYVNIPGEFTIRSALQAFCVNVNLPKPVADSGFPEGFLSSFSLFGKELPHAGISIPPGFRLKGTFNILGLRASVDATLSLPKGIKMAVSLPPLNLAGNLLSMYASSRDKARGPYLVVDITLLPRPSVFVEASGYVSVLGISAEAKLRITNTEYLYSISGRFLGLFEANLEITASYGDIRSASFRVRGSFKNDLFTRIADLVDNAIKKSAEEATRAISAAQKKVENAKGAFDAANRKITAAQDSVRSKNADFDAAIRALRNAENDVRRLCTPPNCGKVCIPSPCGWTCYARVWGACVFGGPSWSSCCFRVPDLICEAARLGCIALREVGLFALRVAREVVDNSRWTLDVAIGVLEGAKGVVNAAKHTLDLAIYALEAAKHAYRVGAAAANAVIQFALRDLFNIKEMTFDVSLSAANGGAFSVGVKARILGNDVNVNVRIDTRNILSVARQLAEEAISGLSSFLG